MVTEKFKQWALSFSGCDGGDIGSKEEPSIWVCGIEWGGGHSPEDLKRLMDNINEEPSSGYDTWEENLAYPYNRQIMKILSVISGDGISNYKNFAQEIKPFVEGSKGYFKMNLYPIAFKDTDPKRWNEEFKSLTGFETKEEYVSWCKENRLPQIKRWCLQFQPNLVIGTGVSYVEDFERAFLNDDEKFKEECIEDRSFYYATTHNDKTLVVVVPFPSCPHGLNSDSIIQKFGERIRELLGDYKRS